MRENIYSFSYVKIMSDVYYPVFTNEVYTDEASLIILVYVVVVVSAFKLIV